MKPPAFALTVNNARIAPLVRESYDARALRALEEVLRPALTIRLTPGGFLKAAERPGVGPVDPTNYHAVWVRDSVWGYYGLRETPGADGEAEKAMLALLDYMSSTEQLVRVRRLIAEPSLAEGERGTMNVPHIRFDANYVETQGVFQDVMVDGKPQHWNHKQNDALGLFLKAALDALVSGVLSPKVLKPAHWRILAALPAYLDRVDYANMEDAGAWEEIERTNTSSIGIVVAALESLEAALARPGLARLLRNGAFEANEPHALRLVESPELVAALIEKGYGRVLKQLPRGESPLYEQGNARYRESDAALLSLIYPAMPQRLQAQDLARILELVEPLVGERGVKRYLGDTYQCAGYWARSSDGMPSDGAFTDDFSSEERFVSRRKGFETGSEAQWFFDSWISKCCGLLHRATSDSAYQKLQITFFNRALGQVTSDEPTTGADGQPVPSFACPESYNALPGGKAFAPSPITPLNWAKASLLIALKDLQLAAKS